MKKQIKNNFQKLMEKSSEYFGKMPDVSRVRIEMYIFGYLVLAFLFLIIIQGFIHNTIQTIIFSVGVAGSLAQFISKSNLYRKLKFIQGIKNANN